MQVELLIIFSFKYYVLFKITEAKFGELRGKDVVHKPRGKSGYVPRNERYNNLLDTAYADIIEKRKTAPMSTEMNNNRAQRKQETINQSQIQITAEDIKTPTVSCKIFHILTSNI